MSHLLTRTPDSSIIVTIRRDRDEEIVPIPPELFGTITASDWESRIQMARKLVRHYSHPVLERLFVFLGIVAFIVVPIVLFRPIYKAVAPANVLAAFPPQFLGSAGNATSVDDQTFYDWEDAILRARWIDFGVFFAIFLALVIPFALWRVVAQSRAAALSRQWKRQDEATQARGQSGLSPPRMPVFVARLPNVFFTDGAVDISGIPTGAQWRRRSTRLGSTGSSGSESMMSDSYLYERKANFGSGNSSGRSSRKGSSPSLFEDPESYLPSSLIAPAPTLQDIEARGTTLPPPPAYVPPASDRKSDPDARDEKA